MLSAALLVLPLIAGCRGNKVGTATCTPGQPVFVACGCEEVGTCAQAPDPVLRVCDGAAGGVDCTWETQLGENDDGPSCGRCPGLTVVCPESGTLYVAARGLYPDEIVNCDWALRE